MRIPFVSENVITGQAGGMPNLGSIRVRLHGLLQQHLSLIFQQLLRIGPFVLDTMPPKPILHIQWHRNYFVLGAVSSSAVVSSQLAGHLPPTNIESPAPSPLTLWTPIEAASGGTRSTSSTAHVSRLPWVR